MFLTGGALSLVLHANYFASSTVILSLTAGSINITDCFFVTNSTTNIMVLLSHTNSNYSVRYYSNSTMIKEVYLQVPSTSKYMRVVKYAPHAFFQFDKAIVVIAMNSSLTQMSSIPMPAPPSGGFLSILLPGGGTATGT